MSTSAKGGDFFFFFFPNWFWFFDLLFFARETGIVMNFVIMTGEIDGLCDLIIEVNTFLW